MPYLAACYDCFEAKYLAIVLLYLFIVNRLELVSGLSINIITK